MGTLSVELNRAKVRGDKKIAKFSGAIRPVEALALEEGDLFTIPENFDVFEQKIGNGKAEYIMVELANGMAKPFYPSTFTKARPVCNPDGTFTGERIRTTGSAVDFFLEEGKGCVQTGMEALKGKKIKVSSIQEVQTLRYGTSSVMTAQIPVLDLVEE